MIESSMNEEVRVYHSVWKNLMLGFLSLLIAGTAGFLLQDSNSHLDNADKLIFWSCLILFGASGLFIIISILYNKSQNRPLFIIYNDRIDCYVQIKSAYTSIYYADVEQFRLVNLRSVKFIAIDYKETSLADKMDGASALMRGVLKFNRNVTGAIENLPADSLTMKANDILELLNNRLETWQETESLSSSCSF